MRILLLVHPAYRPSAKPRAGSGGGTEIDVWRTLRRLGHDVQVLPLQTELAALDRAVAASNPQLVFNLLEEFRDEAVYDFHPVTWLEAMGIAFTGCNSRGLILSRDKFWSSSVASGLGLPVPTTRYLDQTRIPKSAFPAFIKFNREDASLGIQASNRVVSLAALRKEVRRLKRLHSGQLILQEFISGREVSVPVLGNQRPTAYAPWELRLPNANAVATERVKFDAKSRRQRRIRAVRYQGPEIKRMQAIAKRLFTAFDLSGYARFDFRVRDGVPYLIDVNANPNLAKDEDFAASARRSGMTYEDLLSEVIRLGLSYQPRR